MRAATGMSPRCEGPESFALVDNFHLVDEGRPAEGVRGEGGEAECDAAAHRSTGVEDCRSRPSTRCAPIELRTDQYRSGDASCIGDILLARRNTRPR